MRRWVADFGLFSIRLHHWMKGDDSRNYHDHPWSFFVIVLCGNYIDVSPRNQDLCNEPIYKEMKTWSLSYRRANYKHTVKIKKPCWTFILTGPTTRTWGFWTKRKDGSNTYRFMKRNKYFYEYGHHPCE